MRIPPMFGGSSSVGDSRVRSDLDPADKMRDPKSFNKLSFIRFAHLLSLETFGQVAQSVEQRPEKPCVASSILALSTEKETLLMAGFSCSCIARLGRGARLTGFRGAGLTPLTRIVTSPPDLPSPL
jgi:hypothetical protein